MRCLRKYPVRIPVNSACFLSFFAVLTLVLLVSCPGCVGVGEKAPVAKGGVLDLSGWDMDTGGPVRLDGEWEFYFGALLAPKDFESASLPAPTGYASLPSEWNGALVDGREIGGTGYATLRLRIVPGPAAREWGLRILGVKAAYALWLDGKLLAASGSVGKTLETEIPNPSVLLPTFQGDGRPLELVLQVSNHNYLEGGVISPILFGPAETILARQIRLWAVAAFFAGSLLVMGMYHLVLFFFRKNSPSPLYFGFYCLLWLGNYVCSDSSDWAVRLVFPGLAAPTLDKVALICFSLSVPVGYLFFHSLYPREFSRRILGFSIALAAGFVLVAVFGSSLALFTSLPVYYLVSAALIFYCLFMLHRAHRRGREGAVFILVGFFILGLVGLNDMLFDRGLIRSMSLIPVGMFVFILFQSFALARLFSRAFFSIENLSAELENKNVALEKEMIERTKLAGEIVNVSEDERRRLSHDLHDGLCQQLTGARLRCLVLERGAAGERDTAGELAALSSLLEDVVSEAYDLSRGLWPVEHDPLGAGPSLEELARRMSESSGVAIDFFRELVCTECAGQHIVQLYRIAQEAVTNAVKHAKPRRIGIRLHCEYGNRLTLTVRDDGIGRGAATQSKKGGLGLRIMAHRARMIGGELSIADAEGGGTVVTCRLVCKTGVDAAWSEP
ncbi:MAG: 7TM diverse intracellular signaling domain-containing protein [Solidesulfovibrio sp.]